MIHWRDGMSVGAPALDEDHKKLIDLLNAAEHALAIDSYGVVGTVLDELLRYVGTHFKREEAIQAAIRYPDLEAHKKVHEALGRKAQLLHEKFRTADSDGARKACATILNNILQDWLMNHIIKEDMKLKPFLARREGAQGPAPAPAMAAPAGEIRVGMPTEENEDEARRQRRAAREKDIEYQLPPHLSHLLERIEYVIPTLPAPQGSFDSFDKLCEAAICRRIDKVLVFFQRNNPKVVRELPPVFLASPEFQAKFHQAVRKFIFPVIWQSRQVRMLSTNFNWAEHDAESFWDHVGRQLAENIQQGWDMAWDELRLVQVAKSDGSKVLQVKEPTKELREMLAPSTPEAYDLPKVGNREIDIFKSLLDPANDWWDHLNRSWKNCHDLYEQEKDPRIFQQRAREGALRDSLLAAFNRFPEKWGDFLVLTCHRVFPRISTSFLESFTTNLGRSEAEREAHMPYTVRYLRQARENPEIRKRERQDEELWEAQVQQLRNYLTGRESGAA